MQDDNKERIMMGYCKNKGMFCDLPEEERKVWQIQLILEPVGNGGPGGGRWSMGKEGGNLFEKSEIKPAAEKSGGRCLRDGGSIGGLRKRLVGGSEPGHGSTYFIPWSRSSQTQEGIKTNKEYLAK